MIALFWLLAGCPAGPVDTGPAPDCEPDLTTPTGVPTHTGADTDTDTPLPAEPQGSVVAPPRDRIVGIIEIEWLESLDGLLEDQFQMDNTYLTYDSLYVQSEVVRPRAGIDTCEVDIGETVFFTSQPEDVGGVTLSVDGVDIVSEPLGGSGYTGYHFPLDLAPHLSDPWSRPMGLRAPGATLPGFDIQPAVVFPAGKIELTRPELGAGGTIARDDLRVEWNGLGAEPVWIWIEPQGTGVDVRCLVEDDGEFVVPANAFDHIAESPVMTLLYVRRRDQRYYQIAPDQWLWVLAHVEVQTNFMLE